MVVCATNYRKRNSMNRRIKPSCTRRRAASPCSSSRSSSSPPSPPSYWAIQRRSSPPSAASSTVCLCWCQVWRRLASAVCSCRGAAARRSSSGKSGAWRSSRSTASPCSRPAPSRRTGWPAAAPLGCRFRSFRQWSDRRADQYHAAAQRARLLALPPHVPAPRRAAQ